jgi:hypothetical protein
MNLAEIQDLEGATERQILTWLAIRANEQKVATDALVTQIASVNGHIERVEGACRASGMMNGKINRLVTWKQMRYIIIALMLVLSGAVAIDWSKAVPALNTVAKVGP